MVLIWHAAAALAAALVVLSVIRPLSWLAYRYGWVFVHPTTARDLIVQDVPLVGGLAALVGLFTANLISPWPPTAWGVTMGMFAVIAFGLMADLAVLPRWHRMAVLAAASLATVIGSDALFASTGPLLGPFELSMSWIAIPLSALLVLTLAVAFRRVDRADGLCDGLALVAAAGVLGVCWLQAGQGASEAQVSHLSSVALAVVGTLVALAFFTWRRQLRRVASVYLSNAGSSMLGLVTAWLLLQAQGGLGDASIGLGALLWFVSVPIADLLMYGLRVVATGSPETVQDRSRVQNLLQAKFFSMGEAMLIQLGIAIALTAVAIGAWQAGVPDSLLFYGWLMGFAVYAYFAMTFWVGPARQPRDGLSTDRVTAQGSRLGALAATALPARLAGKSAASLGRLAATCRSWMARHVRRDTGRLLADETPDVAHDGSKMAEFPHDEVTGTLPGHGFAPTWRTVAELNAAQAYKPARPTVKSKDEEHSTM